MKEFLLSVSPRLWLGDCVRAGAALRSPVDLLAAIDSSVVHPRSKIHRSFEFQHDEAGIRVADPAAQGWFDSPAKDNLLYFRCPPKHDSICILAGTTPLWYRRLNRCDGVLGAASGHFYRQERQPPSNGFHSLPLAVGRCRAGNAWMNPVMLRLEFAGAELDKEKLGGLLTPDASQDALLTIELMHEDSHRLRSEGQRWLSNRLSDRLLSESRTATIMESLFLGPQAGATGSARQAFWMLDSLGGIFQVMSPGKHPATYHWAPPRNAAANLVWFSEYWRRHWGGGLVEAPEMATRVPAEDQNDCESRPTRTMCVSSDDSRRCAVSTRAQINCFLPRERRGPNPAGVIAEFLETVDCDFDLANPCWNWLKIIEHRTDRTAILEFNDIVFADWIARNYLLPRSPIRVLFSRDPEFLASDQRLVGRLANNHVGVLSRLYVDSIRSWRWGGWEFLARLFPPQFGHHSGRSASSSVRWGFGWWNDWYDWLFRAPRESRLQFEVPASGFVLGKTQWGSKLGWSDLPYTHTPSACL